MFKFVSILAIAAASLFTATTANAAVIDYNAQQMDFITSVTEQGYTTTSLGSLAAVGNSNWCNPQCVWNGSNYLMAYSREGFSFKAIAGTAFGMNSFDAAEVFTNFAGAPSLLVTGYKAGGGTVTQSFVLDGIRDGVNGVQDFQTFALSNFSNLTSVTFSATGGYQYFALDNVNVSPVSETGSLALLSLGLGLMGMNARRRKQK